MNAPSLRLVQRQLHPYAEACACPDCAAERTRRRQALKRALLVDELDKANAQDRGQHSVLARSGQVIESAYDPSMRYIVERHAHLPGHRFTVRREIPKVKGKAARKAEKRRRREARRAENRQLQAEAARA